MGIGAAVMEVTRPCFVCRICNAEHKDRGAAVDCFLSHLVGVTDTHIALELTTGDKKWLHTYELKSREDASLAAFRTPIHCNGTIASTTGFKFFNTLKQEQ